MILQSKITDLRLKIKRTVAKKSYAYVISA